jgi:hypothetical protein
MFKLYRSSSIELFAKEMMIVSVNDLVQVGHICAGRKSV